MKCCLFDVSQMDHFTFEDLFKLQQASPEFENLVMDRVLNEWRDIGKMLPASQTIRFVVSDFQEFELSVGGLSGLFVFWFFFWK